MSEANNRDVVIVGGGHNGLVTAFYLAKAGFKPLVLERRRPGRRRSHHRRTSSRLPLLHARPLRRTASRRHRPRHAVGEARPQHDFHRGSRDFAGTRRTRSRSLQRLEKAAQEIAKLSQKDATKYRQFQASVAKMGQVIGKALALVPPDIDNPNKADLWGMLNTGRALRKLGKRDMYRLLRWGPMAIADLVAEYFETELLRATVAARGIFGTFLGPWSAAAALSVDSRRWR